MTETKVVAPYKLATWHDWSPRALFYHPLQAGSIDGTDLVPHDRGVFRAMLSRYKPNKNVTGDNKKTLFVGRLSRDTTEDMICEIFEEFGEVEKCRLVRDFVTGFSRGFAFVEFKRKRDAITAATETNKMNINGREILVDFECERNLDGWKPRRLGGGFGGCKESGQLRFGGIDRPFKRPLPNDIDRFSRQTEQKEVGDEPTKYEKRHAPDRYRDRSYSGRDRRGQDGYRRDRGGEEKRDDRERDRGRYRDRSRERDRNRDRPRRRSRERDKERRRERSRDRE